MTDDWFTKLPRQIRALVMYLPEPGSVWPEEERAAWFLLFNRALQVAYPVREAEVKPVIINPVGVEDVAEEWHMQGLSTL